MTEHSEVSKVKYIKWQKRNINNFKKMFKAAEQYC